MVKQIGYYIINESAIPGFTDTNIISESKDGRVVAEGILQTADELNRNKRFYPSEELFPQLTAPRTLELLEAGYLRAELGHPLSKDLVRQQTIDDSRTCAQFLKLWTEGKNVMGRFRGTNNAFGQAFNADLLDGCKPAWSLRALGTVLQTNRGAEVRNLKLITWDQVIYPSHPAAYTHKIVSESAVSDFTPRTNLEKLYSMTDYMDNILTEEAQIIPINNPGVINYIKSESKNLNFIKENYDCLYNNIIVTEDGKHVRLNTVEGDTIIVNLEQQIYNDILGFCAYTDDLINGR